MDILKKLSSLFGIIGTVSGIFFAFVACKKSNIEEIKIDKKMKER